MSSPVVIDEPTISRAPNQEMSSIQAYMENCISGLFRARSFSARERLWRAFPLRESNLEA